MYEYNARNLNKMKNLKNGDLVKFNYDDGRSIIISVMWDKNGIYGNYAAEGGGNKISKSTCYEDAVKEVIARSAVVL